MSLYIRLQCGFWTNRKTARLRAVIGDAALWLPPRLWCYAAENQPNGDFSNYLPAELALLLGYTGDAQAMLEALQQASFMDGMRLHGWAEHNGYHAVFSERGKKAASARWGGKDKTGKERKGGKQCNKHFPSLKEAIAAGANFGADAAVVEIWWNEMEGCGWIDPRGRNVQSWQNALAAYSGKWRANTKQNKGQANGLPRSEPPSGKAKAYQAPSAI